MTGEPCARKLALLLFAATLSILSGGCSFVPSAELKVFRESVVTANTAATPILDELSVTERRVKKLTVSAQAGAATFVATDAGYFSDIGDAPATTLFRRAHDVLDGFSEVLVGLATGTFIANDVESFEGLTAELTGLVAALGGAVPGAAPVALAADPAVKGILAVARPGLEQVLEALSRREARRAIAVAVDRDVVGELTRQLIAATPTMFNLLVVEAQDATLSRPSAEARKAYAERADRVRVVMSNYVILLQRVNKAWNDVAGATVRRTTISITVLTERVGELRAAAIATRRAFAEMNAAR